MLLSAGIAPPGVTYQWQRNGVNISGATSGTYTASLAGTYTLIATSSCGSVVSSPVVVTVSALPVASISAQGPTTFCAGSDVSIAAFPVAGATYQWNLDGVPISGAVGTVFLATQPGSYTVSVTNSCGTVTSSSISVTVNPTPSVTISANGPTTFDQGLDVQLLATSAGATGFYWNTGETTQAINVSTSGDYWCLVVDSNGCTSVVSNIIRITVRPIVNPPTGDPNEERNSMARASDNTGLPFRFVLNETFAFRLVGGEEKAQDNITGMLSFIGHFRIYYHDFCPDVLWTIQRPTSMLETFKTLILGRFLKASRKYLVFVQIDDINIEYDYRDRKAFAFGVGYSFKLNPTDNFRLIRFIRL